MHTTDADPLKGLPIVGYIHNDKIIVLFIMYIVLKNI